MNFDDLQALWHSSSNAPSAAALAAHKAALGRRLRAQHRGLVIILSLASGWLLVLAVLFGRFLVNGGAFDARREWLSVALLTLPLTAIALIVRQFLRHRRQHSRYEESIRASLDASLDENRLERLRTTIIATLLAVVAALIPAIVHQLQAVGKAGHEVEPMIVLGPLGLGLIIAALGYRYWRSLLPQKRTLEALLRSY